VGGCLSGMLRARRAGPSAPVHEERPKPGTGLDLATWVGEPAAPSSLAEFADDIAASDLPLNVCVVDWAGAGREVSGVIEGERVVVEGRKRGDGALEPE